MTVANRARIVWSMRVSAALRAAFACAIVGGATVYGPKSFTDHIKFPAFSYLTTVVIVSNATLGDTVKGCWHALCGTVQVVPLAMLGHWIIEPTGGLPVSMAAVAVAAAAFVVALPESTHLNAKRIAFGQIVIIGSNAVRGDYGSNEGFMVPLCVAASTGLGVLASLLALLLPYPDLACDKAQKLCRVYADNASQRIDIYLRAFTAIDNQSKMELLSLAKPLSETGAKLLQSITILQEGMQWERPWRRVVLGERLERMEQEMRGLEYSLVSSPTFPIQLIQEEQLSNFMQQISNQLKEKIEQVSCFAPSYSMLEPETGDFKKKPSLPFEPTRLNHGHIFFFFSCIDMLLNDTFAATRQLKTQRVKTKFSIIRTFKTWIQKLTSYEKLEFAIKCSLSLGLAVLSGLIFNRENGCWAGLKIATSFVTERQAILTISNSRAQGSAIGSVYGVICCFLFHYEEIRLLALLPWIIFASFLRYSKTYGHAGGVSAAIGALLILGRKNYGDPNEFAIIRLTEVFIGLSAFIMVELFLQHVRAATLAKNQLLITIQAIQDCIKETGICPLQKNKIVPNLLELREKQRNLNSLVSELKKFIADADLEPDFWYLPFRTSCYEKLVQTLSNISNLLHFIISNFEIISELSDTTNVSKEFQEQIYNELELLQLTLTSTQKYQEEAISTKCHAASQGHTNENCRDLEAGISQNTEKVTISITELKEVELSTQANTVGKGKTREIMIQCLNATRFCIGSLMKELGDIEICLKEIDQWENRSSM